VTEGGEKQGKEQQIHTKMGGRGKTKKKKNFELKRNKKRRRGRDFTSKPGNLVRGWYPDEYEINFR